MLSQSFFLILFDMHWARNWSFLLEDAISFYFLQCRGQGELDVEIADGGWTGEREKEKRKYEKGGGKGADQFWAANIILIFVLCLTQLSSIKPRLKICPAGSPSGKSNPIKSWQIIDFCFLISFLSPPPSSTKIFSQLWMWKSTAFENQMIIIFIDSALKFKDKESLC